jgi:hypothetical protein
MRRVAHTHYHQVRSQSCTRKIKVDFVKQTSYTLQQANSASRSTYTILRKANFITFETQETIYFSKSKVIRGLTVRLKYKSNHAFQKQIKDDTLNQTSFFSASLQYTLISNSRL